MKKAISLLLSLIIAVSVILPGFNGLDFATVPAGATTAQGSDAYATIFTGSDFQVNDFTRNFRNLLNSIRDGGVTETPDAIFFGGDYYDSGDASDSTSYIGLLTEEVNKIYPYYDRNNLVYVQGNHDQLTKDISSTGLHYYDDFIVYVCNFNDYNGSKAKADALAADLTLAFDRLLADGEDRPIFVITHMPLHHNERGSYAQSAYARPVVEVLNAYGVYMDIIFMFGHNHSGAYDDYIGGSINYIGVGETMYVSNYGVNGNTSYGAEYYDPIELNFTYMNYSYAGYSNNTNGTVTDPHSGNTVVSSNAITMGVLEICPDKIVVSRFYEAGGKYEQTKIINRKTPINEDGGYDEPYVNVAGYLGGTPGTQTGAYANANGFSENAVYTWSSSNEAVATVKGTGSVAQVAYKSVGTSEITVTVTEGSVSKSASYTVTVNPAGTGTAYANIRLGTSDVTNMTLEYYNTALPHVVNLIGCYDLTTAAVTNEKWTSDNTAVATVENGYVKFVGSGTVKITFSFSHGGTTLSASTTFVVSDGSPFVQSDNIVGYGDKYYEASSFSTGNRYVIYVKDNKAGTEVYNKMLTGTAGSSTGTLVGADATVSTDSKGDYIETTNTAAVWEAVATDKSGYYYLKNVSTGKYLVEVDKTTNNSVRFLGTVTTPGDTYGDYYSKFHFVRVTKTNGTDSENYDTTTLKPYGTSFVNSEGKTMSSDERVMWKNGVFQSSTTWYTDLPDLYIYQAETILGEPETEEYIEMSGVNVNGTTQTVFESQNGKKINLYGRHQNFGSGVVDGWTSSNPSVATIDNNGVVTLTGVGGETTITYTIKSDNVSQQTSSFTLSAKTGSEQNRVFQYVDKVEPNEKYVLIYREAVSEGDGQVLSTIPLGNDKLYTRDITVQKNYVDDYLFVEIPEGESKDLVMVSASGPLASETTGDVNKDTFYFSTEESTPDPDEFSDDRRFIGAKITKYGQWGVEGSLFSILFKDVDLDDEEGLKYYQFAYAAPGLYNRVKANVSSDYGSYEGYTGITWHTSNYFGISTVKGSKMMLFKEVEPQPTAVIMSNYEYIGKEVTRDNVCPDQTEQLVAKADNFPEGTKTVTWSSSNTEVATIDQNGKITYTGKPGTTTISLTITVVNDVDGTVTNTQTADIIVNSSIAIEGNVYYQTSGNFVAGNEYVIAHKNNAHTGDSVAKNDDLDYAISNGQYNANISKAELVTVTAGLPDYVMEPAGSVVWKAIDSGVDGYVYLVDQNGNYLSVFYHSGTEDVIHVYPSTEGQKTAGIDTTSNGVTTVVDPVDLPTDSFLIATDGTYIYSKQSGTSRGVSFNYGSSATSTKRFGVGSGKSKFNIYGKTSGTDSAPSDAFFLAENFIAGQKYVIANKNTATEEGMANLLGNVDYNRSKGMTHKHAIKATVKVLGDKTFIQNPDEKAVWECIASGESGYYYLRSVQNSTYLVSNYSDTNEENVLTSVDSLTAYSNPDAYLFQYRMSSDGTWVLESKQNRAASKYVYCEAWDNGGGAFGAGSKTALYLYSYVEAEIDEPITQIRVNGRTTSKDVTNTISNRYYIENGDTDKFLRYVVNVNEGYSYQWTSSDTSIATIDNNGNVVYTGKEGYVTFTLKVTGTDKEGSAYTSSVSTTVQTFKKGYVVSDNDYPAYPYEGSIRVNKTASNAAGGTTFQQSGVTEIELGVTGVPVDQPVDVVIVFDHSSSMTDAGLLEPAMEDTQDFALQILDDNPNNRVAIVTFDSMGTRYTSIDATTTKNTLNEAEAGIITGDGTVENAFISSGQEGEMVEQIEKLITNVQGNTNYDYGLKKAYDILKYAKDKGSLNDPIVVFMSDGEPNQFNGLQVDSSATYSNAWLKGYEEYFIQNGYLNEDGSVKAEYPAMALFNTEGENWYAQAIKTPAGQPTGLPAFDYYANYQEGLGASLFTIGYKMSDSYGLLSRMASSAANYYQANNNLQAAYNEILNQILQAASDAVVTDKMGDHFDVQFATSFSVGNTTLTLNTAPKFEIGYWTLDNLGNRVTYNVIETITFTTNENGILTGATSSSAGDCYDVASNTINGRYVSYNTITETFTWNIGEINRNEMTLKYFACLEGAATGEREAGVFDTNEYATLSYTNYRGSACSKVFPVPTLAWKQAAVKYDFYLVNDAGQPVNLEGIAVPFSERVTIGREQTKQIYINSTGSTVFTLVAADELPAGYKLYNPDAYYAVTVSSTSSGSSAVISDEYLTTYYRDGSYAVNVNGVVPNVSEYANTAVSFAVKYSEGVVADAVVIDYGLPVKINVLGNDYYENNCVISGVASSVTSGTLLNNTSYPSSRLVNGDRTVTLTYGIASIDSELNVVYTPTKTSMNSEEVFYYEFKTEDGRYYYTTVTVIPAANIYYEETFMTFVNGDGYEWSDAGTPITGKFQEEDRPGSFSFADFDADNTYGEDVAYNDSFTYSLGSAKKATVDTKAYGKEPTAKFTFCGTGFDLFSVTSNDTGAVQVTIYKAGTTQIAKNFLVNTYYGYELDEDGNLLPNTTGENALYQVPIISRKDLTYGTYDVVIKPLYSSAFDPNYSNGTGDYSIYVDSVRIFNPAGVGSNIGSDVVKDAYLADGEYAPVFKEIRDTVLDSTEYYDQVIANLGLGFSGSIFLDGNIESGIGKSALATYKTQGPKNEIYLGKGQAIAFKVSSTDREALASLQLGMKVLSGGETAKVTIMNANDKTPGSITLSGTHETFKKLNSAIVWDQNQIKYEDMTQNVYSTLYPIVIVNTSESDDVVISLTSFKWAHTSMPEGLDEAAAVNFMVDGTTPEVATMALRNAMAATQDDEANQPTYDSADVSMEWSGESFVAGEEATLKVTTPVEVVKVTVGGIEITDCKIDSEGNKLWTYSFVVEQSGENAYEVIFYDYNGDASEPVMTETINVDAADPSDDKNNSFIVELFNKIINFLKTVIEFFWRLF